MMYNTVCTRFFFLPTKYAMVRAGLKSPDETSHMAKANVATPKPELMAIWVTEYGGSYDNEQPQTMDRKKALMRNSANTSVHSLRLINCFLNSDISMFFDRQICVFNALRLRTLKQLQTNVMFYAHWGTIQKYKLEL